MVGIPNAYFIIDLECYTRATPAKDRIFKVGALRTDTDQTLERAVNSSTLRSVLAEIDDMSRGAEMLMGHNLIGFDLPLLREIDPKLRLLDLPRYRYPVTFAAGISHKPVSQAHQRLQTG